MLGDGGRRGACLEACIAKLLHLAAAHLVGMSATLSNLQDLCRFMRAEVYRSDFRPVSSPSSAKLKLNALDFTVTFIVYFGSINSVGLLH